MKRTGKSAIAATDDKRRIMILRLDMQFPLVMERG
jgi:hypothetical protein